MGENVIENHVEKHGSYGMKLVNQAAKTAGVWAQNDGLHPVTTDFGEYRYRIQQGLRAACVGREDAAATLMLMVAVLDNQQTIKRMLCVALALLAWIAYKLS
ncbi:hypothetical protein [Burkholderia ubonensis]|uniref:hypothetical protein n=1 Tax=Burkholderia ubonensis TaxID=101571 RepID=UPI000759B6EE|nr:hypothetical protein [Burkholderia ubonensis]KVD64878.1 hypothetical protein WI88_00280 [Burkholderia ubonensis]